MKTILIQYLKEHLKYYITKQFTKENVKSLLEKVYAKLKEYAESNCIEWDDVILSGLGYIVLDDGNIDKFVEFVIVLVNGNICADCENKTVAEEIAPLFVEWAK